MELLNKFSEKLLKYLCDTTTLNTAITLSAISSKFSPEFEKDIIFAAVQDLSDKQLINLFQAAEEENSYVAVTAQGRLYFLNKESQTAAAQTQPQSQVINISASTGITIGNHNNVNISGSVNLDDTRKLIDEQYGEYKEILDDILDILQEQIKSHEIPKSKITKICECLGKGVTYLQPVINSALSDLFKYFVHVG